MHKDSLDSDENEVINSGFDFSEDVLCVDEKGNGMEDEAAECAMDDSQDPEANQRENDLHKDSLDSDENEVYTENDEDEDEQIPQAVHALATGVQAMVVEHHSAACITNMGQSVKCELYYIDMVLDWKEYKTAGNADRFKCVLDRVDFIYLGLNSSGFGDMHKCGCITCGACIVAQDSEKVATWDELAVSTPWARTAHALLFLLHDKFECQDRISFMRSCVDLNAEEVSRLLTLHAVKILPATTLSAKPILEAIQTIFRAQLVALPQPRA